MTTSKTGLSDAEMEDILSLDDEVLQDTYLYHLPANPELIRLPPLLWRRLKYDLTEYLVERESDDKNVVAWYHRQFRETACKRYTYKTIKADYHIIISEYFQGKWANVIKPLELFKKKKGTYPNALRGVPDQPLQYSRNAYNNRTLSELPYQLLQAKLYEDFVKTCCTFDWIHAKAKAFNIFTAMLDMNSAVTNIEDEILEGGELPTTTFVTDQEQDKESEASVNLEDGEQEMEEGSSETAIEKQCSFVVENNASDMKDMLAEIKNLIDVIQLSIDFISRDPNNLATQVSTIHPAMSSV